MTGVITDIALGFIGFGIGSQLRYKVLKSLGKSIISISFMEAFGAFLLVGIGVSLITGKIYMGLIFGALASATAPAATVDVLEEYRSKGPLTTSLLAVVGIDDGISLLLFGFGISIAQSLLGTGGSLLMGILSPLLDIGGAVAAGIIIGFIYSRVSAWMSTGSETLILTVGTVIVTAGIADFLKISPIMTNMIVGVFICNTIPLRLRRIQEAAAAFTPPIYVLFFVLVGSRLKISLLPQMGIIGIGYILLRAMGKFGGAYLGAKISNAPDVVKKYLGLGLFSQAGVAVGLSLAAANILNTPETQGLADTVINVIAATTFVVQIIGPPCTKIAIFKAGEVDPELVDKGRKKS
jgi:NhaP-type Na+/H+ or K+/H+ antiporter